MTRAYIKLDPGFPDRKDYYPDGPWRALVTLFCLAVHQPVPGSFKSERLIKVLLGRHARHLPFLLDERDVVKQRDATYLVIGWKEWQEGNYASVDARLTAIEKRRRPMTPAERAFVYRMRKKERDQAELALKSGKNSGSKRRNPVVTTPPTHPNPVATRRVVTESEGQPGELRRDVDRDAVTKRAAKQGDDVTGERDASRDAQSNITSTLRNVTGRRVARDAEDADEDILPSKRLATLGATA